MERTGGFKNNQSQAVRLSKAVAFPESVKQVDIVTLGRFRLITPAGEAWDRGYLSCDDVCPLSFVITSCRRVAPWERH